MSAPIYVHYLVYPVCDGVLENIADKGLAQDARSFFASQMFCFVSIIDNVCLAGLDRGHYFGTEAVIMSSTVSPAGDPQIPKCICSFFAFVTSHQSSFGLSSSGRQLSF